MADAESLMLKFLSLIRRRIDFRLIVTGETEMAICDTIQRKGLPTEAQAMGLRRSKKEYAAQCVLPTLVRVLVT